MDNNRSSMRRSKKSKNNINKQKLLAIALMLISVLFIAYGFKDSIKSSIIRPEVEEITTERLQDALTEDTSTDETEWIYPTEDYEPVTHRQENTNEYAPIGAFIIPRIDQTLAIMDGLGGNNMYRGASEHYHDQQMGRGNYVLSSHRMYDGTLFGRLEEVEVGDEVYITDYERVYKYEVIKSDNNVEVTQTHLLKDTPEPILTFYGCTSDGEMRVVKQAKLIGYSDVTDLGDADKDLILENLN